MAKPISMDRLTTFQKDYLKQHIKISDHINANQTDLFTRFSIQADHNKLEIISKMRYEYLCAQKHLSIFAYPDIVNLMNINFKNQTELIYESEVQTLVPLFFGPKKEKLTKMLEPLKLLYFGSDGDSKMIAQDNETLELSILQVVSTRWLSLSNVVSNLHQIIFSVIDALQADAVNNSTTKAKLCAQNLLEELDANFILATKFLADILSIILALCKVFQSDYVALSDVYQELNKTINSITIEFIGYPDENIDPTLRTHLFSTTIQQMSIFGEEEIKYLAEYYGEDKIENGQVFLAIINKYELIKEWRLAKLILCNFTTFQFVEGWEFIFLYYSNYYSIPNLTQIIHLALIVPVSNRNFEHVFFQQNLIKTKLCNQIKL
ncbi:46317_t:CDS:2, partial [Gigaspora margarita]